MARNSFSDEPMACIPRGWRSNGPGRQVKRGAQGRQALYIQQRPPAGRQANSARAGRNELEESNKKNKSSPQLLLLHQPSPRPSWGQGFPPAKAVCSSFPEGNGDLNHEWCVYALKFWENATMTGACLVGIAWRAVYMETREVVIGAAMMSSPGPRANIGHVCNHHWDLPRRETIGVCVCVQRRCCHATSCLTGTVVFLSHGPTCMH
jgi:hypothetical protein